jgi:hypothetical protein
MVPLIGPVNLQHLPGDASDAQAVVLVVRASEYRAFFRLSGGSEHGRVR